MLWLKIIRVLACLKSVFNFYSIEKVDLVFNAEEYIIIFLKRIPSK